MISPAQAVLASWGFPPFVTALNLLAGLLYLRGWLAVRGPLPERFPRSRPVAFLTGIATLQIALASPIDAFDAFFLTDHMVQHLLLMMVVPPLVLLGNPGIPIMRGLPRQVRRVVGWMLKHKPVSGLAEILDRPALCWLVFIVAMLGWHLPAPYDLALRTSGWHEAEHATFLFASILFWWPVIQPWPSRARWPRWSVIPYLLLADFANSGLCAFLVFSGRVFYPFYLQFPRVGGLSAENDQVIAGAVMWVVGSVAFLIPAVLIAVSLLSPSRPKLNRDRTRHGRPAWIVRLVLPMVICALPLVALAYGLARRESIDIDGDVPLMHGASTELAVTVFARAEPLLTGPNDFAVLVQDSTSGQAILDRDVQISAWPLSGAGAEIYADKNVATNRLLEAARLRIPSPGLWDVKARVSKDGRQFVLDSTVEVKSRVSER